MSSTTLAKGLTCPMRNEVSLAVSAIGYVHAEAWVSGRIRLSGGIGKKARACMIEAWVWGRTDFVAAGALLLAVVGRGQQLQGTQTQTHTH